MNKLICLLFTLQGALGFKSKYMMMSGHIRKQYYLKTPPSLLEKNIQAIDDWSAEFNWNNMSGESYVTKTLNQHIPQYGGSCWAHGAVSALGDRIKIQHNGQNIPGPDINLAIQYIVNCGSEIAGSCNGSTATGAYEFIHKTGFIPFDSCQTYIACSSDSNEGFCGHVDTSCTPSNICRTCDTFSSKGGRCSQVDYFPNASISEYGVVRGGNNMKIEIYNRGPIACGINANTVLEYGGSYLLVPQKLKFIVHIISDIGWVEKDDAQYILLCFHIVNICFYFFTICLPGVLTAKVNDRL